MRARWIGVGAGAGVVSWLAWKALRKPFQVDGRVALVTGGSRGLGLLIAEELAEHGMRLVICARDERELDRARRSLIARGAEVLAIRCDITDRAQVDSMIERTVDRFGGIDVLVNNAGMIQAGPIGAMTRDDFDEAMAVNFRGAVDVTLAALPHMRRRGGGRIVNITSIGGKVAVPHVVPYDASKFAMVGFSEGLRAELLRERILVTTVVPWLMRTGSAVHARFKGDPERESSLFMASATLPIMAISAERAARRIVRAMIRGEATVTLGWKAKLLRLVHGIAPGLTATALGGVNWLLPAHTDGGEREGIEVERGKPSLIRRLLRGAARRTNQLAGNEPQTT